MSNASALDDIARFISAGLIDEGDYIVITGKASPEGPLANNNRLAEQRAAAFKNYMLKAYPSIRSGQIITISEGEDWNGLVRMIEADDRVPHRGELLGILHSGLSRETQKLRMRSLASGEAYKYLIENIFPYLREGATGIFYIKKEEPTIIRDTVEVVRVDTVILEKTVYLTPEPIVTEPAKKPFYIAVKTNLLYDAALLPNLAVEIPFGRDYRWSVAVDGNWSWWDSGPEKYNYHRIQMAGVELRYWLWNKTGNPLNGWFVGAYGYGGNYDLRLFAKNRDDLGQQSRWSYSAGITAGYAMPIGRRFNLEFSLGLGYLGGEFKKYSLSNCEDGIFPVQSTHKRNYWGPTKAGVSLVWLIGSGVNKNKGKEARR